MFSREGWLLGISAPFPGALSSSFPRIVFTFLCSLPSTFASMGKRMSLLRISNVSMAYNSPARCLSHSYARGHRRNFNFARRHFRFSYSPRVMAFVHNCLLVAPSCRWYFFQKSSDRPWAPWNDGEEKISAAKKRPRACRAHSSTLSSFGIFHLHSCLRTHTTHRQKFAASRNLVANLAPSRQPLKELRYCYRCCWGWCKWELLCTSPLAKCWEGV